MINACIACFRLNPHGNKKCHYCQGGCQLMASGEYGQFRVKIMAQRQKKDKEEEDLSVVYPDLGVFEDSWQQADWQETFFVRP